MPKRGKLVFDVFADFHENLIANVMCLIKTKVSSSGSYRLKKKLEGNFTKSDQLHDQEETGMKVLFGLPVQLQSGAFSVLCASKLTNIFFFLQN